jgi:hypothetical protein
MVLIAGGLNETTGESLATAQLYNPSNGTFTATGNMNVGRWAHTATLLDNGMVLVVGGFSNISSAELYNPATGTFTLTGSLHFSRFAHTASLLNNGLVLIAGGRTSQGGQADIALTELYNPTTGAFALNVVGVQPPPQPGSLYPTRENATATVLSNGKVLVAGGFSDYTDSAVIANANIYDPATGTFTATGSMNTARTGQTMTLLNDGRVLITGGVSSVVNTVLSNPTSGTFSVTGTASAELYDPTTGTFTATGNLNTPLISHTATLLNNGMVLIAGGFGATGLPPATGAELYNPATGTFSATATPLTATVLPATALLNNGNVLLAGGDVAVSTPPLTTAELYEPALPTLQSIAITPANTTIATGASQRFVAVGTFSDNSTSPLASVIWSSSNPGVALVSNDANNHGAVFGVAAGSAAITATVGSVTQTTTVTVTP